MKILKLIKKFLTIPPKPPTSSEVKKRQSELALKIARDIIEKNKVVK